MRMTGDEELYIFNNLEPVDMFEEFTQVRGEYYWPEEVNHALQKFRRQRKENDHEPERRTNKTL